MSDVDAAPAPAAQSFSPAPEPAPAPAAPPAVAIAPAPVATPAAAAPVERTVMVLTEATDAWPAGKVLSLPKGYAAMLGPDKARPATPAEAEIGWPVPEPDAL